MYGVSLSIERVKLSQGIFLTLGMAYHRVKGSAELLEARYYVFLAHLECNAGSTDHLVNHWNVVWQHALVELEKVLRSCTIQMEALHSTHFETLL